VETEALASGDEEAVVLVDVLCGQKMDTILLHDDLRATGDVVVGEIGNVPSANDAFGCDE
jgi:hypothetical protein